jgi:hypothetical protein
MTRIQSRIAVWVFMLAAAYAMGHDQGRIAQLNETVNHPICHQELQP